MVCAPPSSTDTSSSSLAHALLTLATSSHLLPHKLQWCNPSVPTICPQFLPGATHGLVFHAHQHGPLPKTLCLFLTLVSPVSSIWYFPFPSLYDEFFKSGSKFPFSFVPVHFILTTRHHLHSDSLNSFFSVVDYISLTILSRSNSFFLSLLCLSG